MWKWRAGDDPQVDMEHVYIHVPRQRILYTGEITERGSHMLTAGLWEMPVPEKPVLLQLNSVGGDVGAGWSIMSALTGYPAPVTIYGCGECSSMASAILQVGDHRLLHRRTVMLMHHGEWPTNGKSPAEITAASRTSVRELRKLLDVFVARMKAVNRKVNRKWVENWLARDRLVEPREALKLGLVDEVVDHL